MDFTENMTKIIDEATRKYGNDIDRATKEAHKRFKKLPEYNDWVSRLVEAAIKGAVHDRRHIINTAIKKQNGVYGQKARNASGNSRAVRKAAESYYDYFIGGKQLGNMNGTELGPTRDACMARSNGELINVYILDKLQKVVPNDERKLVRNCISNARLGTIFKQARRAVLNSRKSA